MVTIKQQLAKSRYLSALIILQGVSFQLSMAATNIVFYLFFISALILSVAERTEKDSPWYSVWRSPLWRLATLWVLLLYASSTYSSADVALWGFAKKYIKYLLIGGFAVMVLWYFRRGIDLPKLFFLGFAVGGVISFSLSVLNKTTGGLTWLAVQGWIPAKYVKNDFWTSNEVFAHAIFMVILFAYGLTIFLRTKKKSALIFCAIGLFEVFVVSEQRTGFIAVLVTGLWTLWLFLPRVKQKVIAVIAIAVVCVTVMVTENNASTRILNATSEWQNCPMVSEAKIDNLQLLGKACHNNIGLRILFYRAGLEKIHRSWLLGHGLGDVGLQAVEYDWDRAIYVLSHVNNPHNEYLLQGIQLGVVGVSLLVALFVLAFVQALKLNKQRRYLYACIVIVYALSCLFNSFLLDTLQGLFFVLLLAFIIAESCHQQEVS